MSDEMGDERFMGPGDGPDLMLEEALGSIENISIEANGTKMCVSNGLEGFRLCVASGSVRGFRTVTSPYGEECLKIDLSYGGFVIVAPNDFVFDVTQEGFVRVGNLPPVCSLRELIAGFESYSRNPEPSDNIAANIGNYLFQRALIESALIKDFDVEAIARRLNVLISGTHTEEHIQAIKKRQEATFRDFACLARKLVLPDFSSDFVRYWNQHIRLTPWDFYFGLTDKLPGSLVVLRLGPDGAGAFGVIVDAGEIRAGHFRVQFDIPDRFGELDHMDSADLSQAEAILPQLMDNLSKTCQSLGIDELRGEFSGAGSYLGAKAGFVTDQEECFRMREELRTRVERLQLGDADRQTVLRVLESDEPSAIQELAGLDLPYMEASEES